MTGLDVVVQDPLARCSINVVADARVWARAQGLTTPRDPGAAVVSKAWARLDEKYGLVERRRKGRLLEVVALHEDGSRRPYDHPDGRSAGDRYFKIPFAYWTDDWYWTLSLPAKAVLLIALSLRSPFVLPAERAPDWYGISADTIERGLRDLRKHGLLDRSRKQKPAPLAPTGFTLESHYRLQAPFGSVREAGSSRRSSVVSAAS